MKVYPTMLMKTKENKIYPRGYPTMLMKTKENKTCPQGYPTMLLKIPDLFDLSYDVYENKGDGWEERGR